MLKWLVDLRKEKRKTQCEVAFLTGISQSHYAAIENGVRKPSVGLAKKISSVLGFPWTQFYEICTDQAPNTPPAERAG